MACWTWPHRDRLVAYWDVDAPATLERLRDEPAWYFGDLVPRFDVVLTYGGGPPVIDGYTRMGRSRRRARLQRRRPRGVPTGPP